ncbi:MAG: DUF1800 family protein, partial [Candidatus Dormibacteraeota bacterium]|nr:DUF1800 family protein [Candidatus Dormibacteraeota bacterium]
MNGTVPRPSRRQMLAAGAVGVAGVAGAGAGIFLLPRHTSTSNPLSAAGPDGAWASTLGTARGLAAHLLRRAGFGYSDAELDAAASMRYSDLVEKVIAQQPEDLPAIANPADYRQVIVAWQSHMASATAQYPDRVAFFWHGVLTSDFRNAVQQPVVLQQLKTFRSLGRSDLRSLLLAITYDPLMIRYLDLQQSSAAAPNENYARELMELFTLGPGNYTETDVREGARIFSGIRAILVDATGAPARLPSLQGLTVQQQLAQVQQLIAQGYSYKGVMQPRLHDQGEKTYLKQSGNLAPEQAIDILLSQPACAAHVATRALVHFATPNPSKSLVDSVATKFRASKYDMTALMRAIFTSSDFTAAANYRSLVRSPVDYTVAAMRALGRPELTAQAALAGAGMAQVLYDPPNVGGWPNNAGWIASSTWLARLNFAAQATSHPLALPDPRTAQKYQLDGVVGADTAAQYKAATT